MHKQILLNIILLLVVFNCFSQQDTTKGFIIAIKNSKIYLDYTDNDVNVGDMLKVIKKGGYFTHPVTGEMIKEKDEIVAKLEIINAYDSYSEAITYPTNLISKLEIGMRVYKISEEEQENNAFKKSIAVHSLNVVGAEGSYLGLYMADLLVQSIYESGNFRVIDRQTIDDQMQEMNYSLSGYINEEEAVNYGRTAGVDYFIMGMVDLEVRETSTGIPFKSMVSAAEILSGKNLGSDLVSNSEIKQLTAISNVSIRVVEVKTGEIKFICTEMAKAQGKSSVQLEGGALGGLKLNGGATDFMKTVSGKASQQALSTASIYISDFFEGEITEPNYKGNVVYFGNKTKYELNQGNFKIGDIVLFYDKFYYEIIYKREIIGIHTKKNKVQITGNSYLVNFKQLFKIDKQKVYKIAPNKKELTIKELVIFYSNGFKKGIIINLLPETKSTQLSVSWST